jgi:hypothetical protein
MPKNKSQLKLFGSKGIRDDNQLLIGTSSWTGDGWVGSFYPPGSKPGELQMTIFNGKALCLIPPGIMLGHVRVG